MSDPYDLLRRARVLLKGRKDAGARAWMKDFLELPGASLSEEAVQVLRDSRSRCEHTQELVEGLVALGLLHRVRMMKRCRVIEMMRRTVLGREALRLREDVVLRCPGCHCAEENDES